MGIVHGRVVVMGNSKLNFAHWKKSIECQYNVLPEWYKNATDKQREVMWVKYLNNEYIGD